jgi:uncharacterized OB-fold protein
VSGAPPELLLSRCPVCDHRFIPRPGSCPRCGSAQVEPFGAPASGKVLAATELMVPVPGWSVPHRLAILELVHEIRLLVVVDGGLPSVGDVLPVTRDGALYRSVVPPP